MPVGSPGGLYASLEAYNPPLEKARESTDRTARRALAHRHFLRLILLVDTVRIIACHRKYHSPTDRVIK